MAPVFFDSAEAAQELTRRTGQTWTVGQVHRAAEAGNLPVCFRFGGQLGVFDQTGLIADVISGKAKRSEYFPAGCYLRSRGGVVLGLEIRDLRGHESKVDRLRPRSVEVVQTAPGFTASEFLDLKSNEILCLLSESNSWKYTRNHSRQVPADEWLFHVDDLAKLTAEANLSVRIADGAEYAETGPGNAKPQTTTYCRSPLVLVSTSESKLARQDRRLQVCIDAGLPMETKAARLRLPDGVGNLAEDEGVTRQAFSADVKAALKRRENARREGVVVRKK